MRFALKINLPNFFYTHVVLAAAYGQLGDRVAAGEALRELLVLRPDFGRIGRDDLGKWYPPELVEQLIDGLRKAGLDHRDVRTAARATTVSGTASHACSGKRRRLASMLVRHSILVRMMNPGICITRWARHVPDHRRFEAVPPVQVSKHDAGDPVQDQRAQDEHRRQRRDG